MIFKRIFKFISLLLLLFSLLQQAKVVECEAENFSKNIDLDSIYNSLLEQLTRLKNNFNMVYSWLIKTKVPHHHQGLKSVHSYLRQGR